MRFRLAITSVAAALAACSGTHESAEAATETAQDEAPSITLETTDLGDGLYMLASEYAGNVGLLVGPDGAVMVDDQLPGTGGAIEGALIELAGEGAPRFIVNTHWHADHAGGNAHFAQKGSTIATHHNIRTRIDAALDPWTQEEGALPILTFGSDLTFHMNGQTVEVTHIPQAHTDGDAIVYFREADVLHMGDLLFSGLFPFIDLSAGGTVDGYIAGLEQALEIAGEETVVIAGHGPLSTPADIQASIDMLREAAFRVRTLVEGGGQIWMLYGLRHRSLISRKSSIGFSSRRTG